MQEHTIDCAHWSYWHPTVQIPVFVYVEISVWWVALWSDWWSLEIVAVLPYLCSVLPCLSLAVCWHVYLLLCSDMQPLSCLPAYTPCADTLDRHAHTDRCMQCRGNACNAVSILLQTTVCLPFYGARRQRAVARRCRATRPRTPGPRPQTSDTQHERSVMA